MIKIIKRISFYESQKFIKKSAPFSLPILLGVIYRLLSISLFIIPIQGINSVSKGTLSLKLKNLFQILNIPIPSDNQLFTFFSMIMLLALTSLFLAKILKNISISNIKRKINSKFKIANKKPNKEKVQKKFKKVDYYIQTSENITLCMILIILIIFFDLQIALITLGGGYIYFMILANMFIKNIPKLPPKKKINSKHINLKYLFFQFCNMTFKDKQLSNSLFSAIIMFLILLAIYNRTDPTISIIFIFLVRIFQNQMFKGINLYIANNK